MGLPSETSKNCGADGQINTVLAGNPSWRRCTAVVGVRRSMPSRAKEENKDI